MGQRPQLPESHYSIPGSRPNELLPGVKQYIECMTRCWQQSPEQRPTFEEVVRELEAIAVTVADHGCALWLHISRVLPQHLCFVWSVFWDDGQQIFVDACPDACDCSLCGSSRCC
jgi:hypothetical protein